MAISWAVVGVRGRLINPSHRKLPDDSKGYLGLVLRQARGEQGLTKSTLPILTLRRPLCIGQTILICLDNVVGGIVNPIMILVLVFVVSLAVPSP